MIWAFFFFFKQKTAYELRISDWSSDVCSSDLRLLHRLDHVGDGVGLARTGDAEQRLLRQAALETVDQLRDRLRLVASGLERRDELEIDRMDGVDHGRAWGRGLISLANHGDALGIGTANRASPIPHLPSAGLHPRPPLIIDVHQP